MKRVASPLLVALLLAVGSVAEGPPPAVPLAAATLPPVGEHWVWVPDRILRHSLLYDGDTGDVVATLDSGVAVTPKLPLHARSRGEFYEAEIAYSRGHRGERLDFVTIYDTSTLAVKGEVVVPTRTADSNTCLSYVELLDDDAFLLLFNQFPNTSVSVVDLEARRFVGEVVMSGCAGIYPVDARSFAMLCGDGTVAQVHLDDAGRRASLARSEPFFDPVADPVVMAAARDGQRWYFLSFEGQVHVLDFAGAKPVAAPPWSLLDDADRGLGWRLGGLQQVALHRASSRLYTVMHRGGPGSHKEAGPQVWVYDAERRERVARIDVPNLAAAFLGVVLGLEEGGWARWLMGALIPNQGVHSIAVTQDAAPLLFARHAELGVVAVLDAETGEHRRNLDEAGLIGPSLGIP